MSSVETGRVGPKLESAPHPQRNENSDDICYCPDCGARLRLVGRDSEDDGDRSTLPDWLPAASAVPNALPASPTSALPALETVIRGLPEFRTLSVPPDGTDDDDEPTHVVRNSVDLSRVSASMKAAAADPTDSKKALLKPPVPARHHDAIAETKPSPQASPRSAPLPPPRVSDVARVESAPSRIELPTKTQSGTVLDAASPPVQAASSDIADYSRSHAGVPSTEPTSRDVSLMAGELQELMRAPRRKALRLSVGIGCGIVVLSGLALLLRGPSESTEEVVAAAPVAANSTTTRILSALPAPEPDAQSAASAEPESLEPESLEPKRPEPKEATVASREPARTESAKSKDSSVKSATSTPQESKAESDEVDSQKKAAEERDEELAEEDPFDAAEAASALDGAAERASSCRQESDPSGTAVVTITFAPSGRVTTATIAGPPFFGTPTGSCIARTMRSATVPAFSGKLVTVRKTVTIH